MAVKTQKQQKMLVDGVPLLRNIGGVGCSIFLIRESRQKSLSSAESR